MSSVQQGIATLIGGLLVQMNFAASLAVVSWTLLLYDWILNIDLEVKYIWSAPWKPGRILYHFNRIWPIILLGTAVPIYLFTPSPSPEFCKRATLYYAYGVWAECAGIYFILLLRLWALYSKRAILYGLIAGWCTSVTLSGVFVAITMKDTIYFKNPVPTIFTHGCTLILPPRLWLIYVVPLIYDTTFFTLTVWRVWILSKEYGSTPLMKRLVENGAVQSGVLVTCMLFACIGCRFETIRVASNGSGILGAISSVACSRIMFSLYTLNEDQRQQPISATAGKDTGGDIHFAVPMEDMNSTGRVGDERNSARSAV